MIGIYDWGQQHGLIMGLEHWRHYIKPQMARLYKKVKDKRLFAFQHSCGDCHELFPDLIESGLDCYQTFQPEVYDVREMKKPVWRPVGILGRNIDTAMPAICYS